ncbi:hypothetical protein [Halosegnis sp.]|uniref:hypothetical protein n=1 Tax=Halosegnis sp. TaxID=2864959 RepID=UPI0035D4514A
MRLLARPLAFVGGWLSDHPLRLSGGLAALGGTTAAYLAAGPTPTAADLLAFATGHPAYAAAILVGVATLLFVDG